MKSSSKSTLAVNTLALGAAALFVSSCSKGGESAPAASAEQAAAAEVKCVGVNECKGTGACGVPGGHSCAGQNECKGKGWLKLTADDCATQGGTPQQS